MKNGKEVISLTISANFYVGVEEYRLVGAYESEMEKTREERGEF